MGILFAFAGVVVLLYILEVRWHPHAVSHEGGSSMGQITGQMKGGGNIVGRTNTVSLEIYNSVFTGDYERAALLAGLLGLASLAAMAGLRWLSARE